MTERVEDSHSNGGDLLEDNADDRKAIFLKAKIDLDRTINRKRPLDWDGDEGRGVVMGSRKKRALSKAQSENCTTQ